MSPEDMLATVRPLLSRLDFVEVEHEGYADCRMVLDLGTCTWICDVYICDGTDFVHREHLLFTKAHKSNRIFHFGEQRLPLKGVIDCDEPFKTLAGCLAFFLDQSGDIQSDNAVPWLKFGRKYQHLTPWEIEWEKERVERERQETIFRARPHCSVDRQRLRVELNRLRDGMKSLGEAETLIVGFDGTILLFKVKSSNSQLVAVVAEGSPWESTYSIPAVSLAELPKRLVGDTVEVGVWKSMLGIGAIAHDWRTPENRVLHSEVRRVFGFELVG